MSPRTLPELNAVAPDLAAAGPTEWPEAPRLAGPPEPMRLPLDVLPSALQSHVRSVSAATQTPADMGLLLALAAVSAAVRGRAEVAVDRRGWREPACIYVAPVLPPASRKSPVYAAMTGPLERWQGEAAQVVGPAHRRTRDAADVAAARLAGLKAAAAKGKATAYEVENARRELDVAERAVVPLPRLLASDATPEALVRLLAEQGGALAVMAPEADPFGIADGRYSDTPRVDELLRAWGGEPITVDRIGRDPIHVPRACVTLAVAMQPAALEAMRHGKVHRGRGLYARVLWCVPPHGLGTRRTGHAVPALDNAAASAYAALLYSILGPAERPAIPGAEPLMLTLDEAALGVLYGYEAEVEAQLADGGELAGVRDYAGKIVGQAVRLAALLHIAAEGAVQAGSIGALHMQGGVGLARALTTHARAVLESALDERTAALAYVLRRARGLPPGSTLRDLHDATRDRAGLATMDALLPLVEELAERGCLRTVPQERPGPGRPPSPRIELHPALVGAPQGTNPQNRHKANTAGSAGNAGGIPGDTAEVLEL